MGLLRLVGSVRHPKTDLSKQKSDTWTVTKFDGIGTRGLMADLSKHGEETVEGVEGKTADFYAGRTEVDK